MSTDQRSQLRHRSKRQRQGGVTAQPNAGANWQRKLDHYLARARELADAGDRVEAESCYQYADHYFRLIRGTAS